MIKKYILEYQTAPEKKMSYAYPISSPVEFVNTTPDDTLIFNANGPAAGSIGNLIKNFVTTNPGDLIYRDPTGSRNVLERLALGTAGNVLSLAGMTTPAEVDITTTADTANSLDGTYFLLDCPTGFYYVWYSTSDGSATDPILGVPVPADLIVDGELRTGIMVSITTDDSAAAVASATETAIALDPCFTVPAPGSNPFTVVMADAGPVLTPSDGLTPPNGGGSFTYATSTTGAVPSISWSPPSGIPAIDMFMAEATAAVASAVTAGSTWVAVVDPDIVTWSTAAPNHNAGSIFAAGVFTPMTTGLYAISASVAFEGNNRGNGGGGIPGRRAIRQARLRGTGGTVSGVTLAFSETQAQGNNMNPTQLPIVNATVSLTAGDTIELQVRHDSNVSLGLNVEEETSVQGPSIYFTAHRVN